VTGKWPAKRRVGWLLWAAPLTVFLVVAYMHYSQIAYLVAFGPFPQNSSPIGNPVVWVTNQSYDKSPVDIRVSIDGFPKVVGVYYVGDQHLYSQYELHLPPGRHEMTVSSILGSATGSRTFHVTQSQLWIAIAYWFDKIPNSNQGVGRFEIELSSGPLGIR